MIILLLSNENSALFKDLKLNKAAFCLQRDAKMHIPMQIGDFTDFMCSRTHVENLCLAQNEHNLFSLMSTSEVEAEEIYFSVHASQMRHSHLLLTPSLLLIMAARPLLWSLGRRSVDQMACCVLHSLLPRLFLCLLFPRIRGLLNVLHLLPT